MFFKDFFNFVDSPECYLNHDVSYIDRDGLQHYLNSDLDFCGYLARLGVIIAEGQCTIKVEQMERLYQLNDRTMHFFYNPAHGTTFKEHTDPHDVHIECHDGEKVMEVEGKVYTIHPGETLLIPANVRHRAINDKKALMVSYAINDTETLIRLCENN